MARKTPPAPADDELRRADRRHRRRGGDAGGVPRVRLLRHLLPRPARRPRRSQAGAAQDPLLDVGDGPAPRPRSREVLARRGRRDGQVPPARRHGDLRRPGPDGAAVHDAPAAGRRPRQLRLARRRPGCLALHRGQAGLGRDADGDRSRRGDRRLHPQLRRPAAAAGGASGGVPQPPRQRGQRDRGRHGHQHGPAQPRRGDRRGPPPHRQPDLLARRPDAVRAGSRPARRAGGSSGSTASGTPT